MTDFLVSPNNTSGLPASTTWQQESYNAQLKGTTDAAQEPAREVNLREALEWLLRNPEGHEVPQVNEEEKTRRKERKVDLLIWLLNLELRLSPYHEPA
ncbi:MAG: hypothetical protein SGJ27_20250 [Candidatus Melainabacteria bacterium]|nr:hypothetical protein [Candidatus Melainabacteria bacterium]